MNKETRAGKLELEGYTSFEQWKEETFPGIVGKENTSLMENDLKNHAFLMADRSISSVKAAKSGEKD